MTCDNTFGLDPLYCTYDDKGNPVGGNQGGVFVNLSLTGIRTQVDYTISEDTYFNFGGEGTGGINTKLQDPVIFGASKDDGIIDSINQLNNTKRMNITIDATEKDVYVYINAPSKYTKVESGKGSYVKTATSTRLSAKVRAITNFRRALSSENAAGALRENTTPILCLSATLPSMQTHINSASTRAAVFR